MDTDLNIDDIVTHRQRKVKGYSDSDKIEDSNDLNMDWVDQFLAKIEQPRKNKEQPEPEMRWAIRDMDRRIKHEDFRDRFPDKESSTSESRTKSSFKKALRSFTQSYTRSLKLVK